MEKEENNREDNKNTNLVSQPHDAAFKKLFGYLEIAKDVIEKNLPKEVLDQLDMNSLKQIDGSFVSNELKETFSDIIYGVKINGKDAYITVLFEHKSKADKLAIFQVAGYVIDIWKKIIEKNKTELPVVIPLIVYHGQYNWNYKQDMREMIPYFHVLPEYLKQMLPVIRHEFLNLRATNEEEISKYKPVTRLVLRSFKYIYDNKDKIIEMLIISIDEIDPETPEEVVSLYLDLILIYFSSTHRDISEEDIIQKIHELGGKGEKIMTILQAREQKGIELGKQKGIEVGKIDMVKEFLKEGADMELIIRASKLPREKIEEIKKELSS